ncbi:MAG: glycosyl hydrolase [Clostridia bacterium]
MGTKISKATQRAIDRGYYEKDDTWFTSFRFTELTGDLAYEEGIVRRDPSRIVLFEGKYYVYYTRSAGKAKEYIDPKTGRVKDTPWDLAELWYATSEDGYDWKEIGIAVERGGVGAYDERSVFTPEVLDHDGKYYLTYQCDAFHDTVKYKNTVGMAIAENPNGPFVKLDAPILHTSNTGEWEDENDRTNRNAKTKGEFDSYQVHDPCLMYFKNKFYLYYKGETIGESVFMGGRDTKWGVAIAEKPEGPYLKSEYNPISNSGHEICVWHYNGGIAGLITSDGMEKNTIQFAEDGENFDIMSTVCRWEFAPHAAGLYPATEEDLKNPLGGLTWGLELVNGPWNYIRRFDMAKPQSRGNIKK